MGNALIGNVELGNIPRIVAIIDKYMPIDNVKSFIERGASLLEIRVDLFPEEFDDILEYIEVLNKQVRVPLICTIRETEKNRENRLTMFKKIVPFVDAIDIEIDTDINREVINYSTGKTVIISYHDFEKTPENSELSNIIDKAIDLGADIVKISTMANSSEDVARLLCFAKERPENLVVIAMGEIGRISRIDAPLFASLFTYAFVNDEVAPGQLSLDSMVKELKSFYPSFKLGIDF